jgi:hypothetical protein
LDQGEPDGHHVHTMKADPAQCVYTTFDVLLTGHHRAGPIAPAFTRVLRPVAPFDAMAVSAANSSPNAGGQGGDHDHVIAARAISVGAVVPTGLLDERVARDCHARVI